MNALNAEDEAIIHTLGEGWGGGSKYIFLGKQPTTQKKKVFNRKGQKAFFGKIQ